MPPFWVRFYLRQSLLLAIAGLALLSIFNGNRLDLLLADPWYDQVNHLWPERNAWWSKILIHSWFKGVLILAALACLWTTWRHRKLADHRRWRLVAASAIVVPLMISLWKRTSPLHCPWDVDRYGGFAPYFDLLSSLSSNIAKAGHCFPAGFVSTSGWLLAFALLRYPENRRFSWGAGLGAGALCLGLGFVQQMRGAHFLSHVLWSIWISWALVVALHALLGVWRAPASETPNALSS